MLSVSYGKVSSPAVSDTAFWVEFFYCIYFLVMSLTKKLWNKKWYAYENFIPKI